MREFKFRIWDIDRKAMLGSQYVIFYDGDFYENYRDLEDGILIENIAVMQSTGLEDKNDVEIYEGDIYRYEYYTGSGVEYRNRVVEWETTEVAYEGVFHGYELNNYEIEVIGNIYQNNDLLEG